MQIPDKFYELGFEIDEYNRRFAKLPKLYKECLAIYISTNDIARLQQLFNSKQWIKAEDCAHNLKGAAGNLALMSLYRLYDEICVILRGSETSKASRLITRAADLEEKFREAAELKTKK